MAGMKEQWVLNDEERLRFLKSRRKFQVNTFIPWSDSEVGTNVKMYSTVFIIAKHKIKDMPPVTCP